jgi:hypothetical protein
MIKTACLSALLFAGACSKKDDNKAAGTTGAAPAAPAGAPAAAATPADQKFTCDTILSKALRDKYFAGHTVENIDFPVKHNGKCKIVTPDGKDFELSAACAPFMKNAKDATVEGLKKQFTDMKEVPGAGDVALARDISPDLPFVQFTAYNKGSFCMASGTLPKSIDTNAFLTEWLASLPAS